MPLATSIGAGRVKRRSANRCCASGAARADPTVLAVAPVHARPSSFLGLNFNRPQPVKCWLGADKPARSECDGRLGSVSEAGLRCVFAESTERQREGRSGPGGESGSPVVAVAPRADADVPAVRAGLGETLPVCAALQPGQRGVLVSHLYSNAYFAHSPSINTRSFVFFFAFAPSSRARRVNLTVHSCCFYVTQRFHLSIRAARRPLPGGAIYSAYSQTRLSPF